jgi:CBS domain-containing protein
VQLTSILSAKGSNVLTIQPQASVAELIVMLSEHSVGALIVSEDGSTINGIVSERDVVHALAHGSAALDKTVSSIMTAQVHCAPPDAAIDDLMHLMTERRIRHVPITDAEGLLIGIVSIGDIVKSRLGELEGERAALMDYITRGG